MSFPFDDDDLLDDDEDEANIEEWSYSGRNGILFLIDFRQPMFAGNWGKCSFRQALECCRIILLNMARKGKASYEKAGIVLFGVKNSSGSSVPPGVVCLQNLETSSVERITFLNDLNLEECDSILSKFGQDTSFSLAKTLRYCQTILMNTAFYGRSIVMFTTDDDPYKNEKREAHAARKQALELAQHGIDLDLVPLGNSFDSNKFYKEIVLIAKKDIQDSDWIKLEPMKTIEETVKHIVKVTTKVSRMRRYFHFGESLKILTHLYRPFSDVRSLVTSESKGSKHRRRPEPQQAKENQMDEDAIDSAGPSKVPDPEQEIILSNLPPENNPATLTPGFTFIGFCDSNIVPDYYSIKRPQLMTPDLSCSQEALFFSYIHKACLQKGLSMVCWCKFSSRSPLKLVALNPHEEFKDSGGQIFPAGFCVTYLPFQEGIREPEEDESKGELSEDGKDAAKEIVNKLDMTYLVDQYYDIDYKRTVAMIEAIALQYDEVEEVNDNTDIKVEDIDTKLGPVKNKFVMSRVKGLDLVASTLKRSAHSSQPSQDDSETDSSSAPPAKKKADKLQFTIPEIIAMIKSGKGNVLLRSHVEEFLSSEGYKGMKKKTKTELLEIAKIRLQAK